MRHSTGRSPRLAVCDGIQGRVIAWPRSSPEQPLIRCCRKADYSVKTLNTLVSWPIPWTIDASAYTAPQLFDLNLRQMSGNQPDRLEEDGIPSDGVSFCPAAVRPMRTCLAARQAPPGKDAMFQAAIRWCLGLLAICFALTVWARDIESIKQAAQQGDAKAQYELGYLYDAGRGVAQSYAEAAQWYRKAAEQGNASAQYNLGTMYDKGQGVTQSRAEARKWYDKAFKSTKRAAEQGDAQAQYNLGYLYDMGRAVAQSTAEAAQWYRKAAEQGDARAQFSLGAMYDKGQGVAPSAAEAFKWYRRAAELGHVRAQNDLVLRFIKTFANQISLKIEFSY